MGEVLELLVHWPSGRDVRLDIDFMQPMAARPAEAAAAAPPDGEVQPKTYGIERDDLDSEKTMMAFLRHATRGVDSDEVVEAICWTTYHDLVYERLGLKGGEKEPVPVKLPADE